MRYFLYCRKSTEDEERQVLSLQSQREALDRSFAEKGDIEVIEVFEESRSAKTPGRPVFATMLARIEAGEADGIMSWAPDRLARNSIDGGRIIYLLDTGALRDLKFATYTFENNSQGKFMLSIMFGQSKYYSDALSENVRRGNRTKLENGWRPNRAPLGYLNDPATRTIVPDPAHFSLVRRMFEMVLYEGHTPRQIVRIARDEWGFLTPRSRRSGGKPIANSTIYKILANPFYKGVIEWNGDVYAGRHTPVVSPEEFDRVQALTGTRSTPHPQRLSFPFTGLIECGACGKMVTAERKRNRYGSSYIYYHCSARSLSRGNCRERSIEARELETQMIAFLHRLRIPEEVAQWVRDELALDENANAAAKGAARRVRGAAIAEIDKQLAELTSLRIRSLLTDEEYVETRSHLAARRSSLENAAQAPDAREMIEPFELLVSASNNAVEWFAAADDGGKRALLKITGSNPSLKAKRLSIQAAKPFFAGDDFARCPRLRGDVDVVRENGATLVPGDYRRGDVDVVRENGVTPVAAVRTVRKLGRRLIKELRALQESPEAEDWFENLRSLVHRFEPPAPMPVQKSRASGQRRGRGALPRALRCADCAHRARSKSPKSLSPRHKMRS